MTKNIRRVPAGGMRQSIAAAAGVHRTEGSPLRNSTSGPPTRRSRIRRADDDSGSDSKKDDDKKDDDDDRDAKDSDTDRASSGPLYDGSEDS